MNDIPFARKINVPLGQQKDMPKGATSHRVIAKFGGPSRLAHAIGLKHVSTVGQWVARGMIPLEQWPNVMVAAQSMGVELSILDFIPDEWRELETDPSTKQSENDL